MRVLFALIALVSLVLASAQAHARNWHHGHSHGHRYAEIRRHASPLVIYEYDPGVIVRAYWRAPWRNRHYYPTTGEKPGVGREEDLSAASPATEPAENYSRSWSTSSAFANEEPRASAPRQASDPREDRNQEPNGAKP